MVKRASSFSSNTTTAIDRLVDGRYAVIKEVSEHLDTFDILVATDIAQLASDIADAVDFSGITVTTLSSTSLASWDSINKILSVPTTKGDTGDALEVVSVATNVDHSITLEFSEDRKSVV